LHGRVVAQQCPESERVQDTHRLKSLEDENAKREASAGDTMLDNVVLKDLLGKSWTTPNVRGL